jgi:hypothetical protein
MLKYANSMSQLFAGDMCVWIRNALFAPGKQQSDKVTMTSGFVISDLYMIDALYK